LNITCSDDRPLRGETTVPLPNQVTIAPAASPFGGIWQGTDLDDGSVITVTLSQSEQNLTGSFTDTFSGTVPPPGFEGGGSGTVTSASTAQMTFNLTRSDGRTLSVDFSLELSNGNNTLTMYPAGIPPIVLQRLPGG